MGHEALNPVHIAIYLGSLHLQWSSALRLLPSSPYGRNYWQCTISISCLELIVHMFCCIASRHSNTKAAIDGSNENLSSCCSLSLEYPVASHSLRTQTAFGGPYFLVSLVLYHVFGNTYGTLWEEDSYLLVRCSCKVYLSDLSYVLHPPVLCNTCLNYLSN